jgi:2,4-dienoyl-CoA reductase (NADPH2)
VIFEPIRVGGIEFRNRILRSSIGGKTAFYNGTVGPAWTNFEKRFAATGVAGIVSATLSVNSRRWAPIEYPMISDDGAIAPLKEAVAEIKALGPRYIIQIGDPGSHTQMGLFPEAEDGASSATHFDLLYGYRSLAKAMSTEDIGETVENFARAAKRVRDAGADGIEVTASKGYLIHQFLNPGINRRRDAYGGSLEKRFRFLREVIEAVRGEVGRDFLLGVRLSAADHNLKPLNLRLPPAWPLRAWLFGNRLEDTLYFARELETLGVDYLHVSSGYGFINPHEVPGGFPFDELRIFFNHTRHLSGKAWARATLFNLMPRFLGRRLMGVGWSVRPGSIAASARLLRQVVSIPVIANGGFQQRSLIEGVLADGTCDMVSIARPLLANPDLLRRFQQGHELPERPCTFCNRCTVRTAVMPLGCYDPKRFRSQDEMERQILEWSGGPAIPAGAPVEPLAAV